MLEGLRAASQNWFGRGVMAIVMGFIILTFAIWGIGDVFRGFSSQRLVKVGSGEVTVEAFRSSYQNELRRLQQRLRRAVTNEEARRAGFDQQVLDRLITEVVLDQRARGLGLAISDQDAQDLLKKEPEFKGPGGQFDAERYKIVIRDMGLTERAFLQEQKTTTLRKEIIDAVTNGVRAPNLMVEAFHRFRSETRTIDAILLPPSIVGAIPAPSEEEVKKFFNERESAFRAREFRKLTLLAATTGTLAKPAEVPQADVKKLYDEVKGQRFGTAEKREAAQIVFKTEAEAKDALARLKGGLSFDALIAERKLNPKDVELGLVTQSDFGNPVVGAAVFATPSPGYAEVAATPFGYVVSEVRKIVPAVYSKSFEQVEAELRREVAQRKVTAEEIRKLHDAIEDQRTAGKTLKEAAATVGLTTRDVDGVDEMGRDRAGAVVADLPGGPDLLKAAFASDKGVDNEAVTTKDGGYVWFEVADVEQARQRGFEEVKGEVEAALRREAEEKALNAKADALVEQMRAGKPIDNLAGELGLPLRHVTEVRRANRPDYPPSIVLQFFEVPPRGAGSVAAEGGRLVFFVAEATTPQFDPAAPENVAIAEQLKPALINDIYEQYVGGLEKALNLEINQKALQSALGGEAEK
jgi:peptidyl-prolyl cis-trans isomerase D